MKIKVHVTKEILKSAMYCGVNGRCNVPQNCAIALAVREIAPNAGVYHSGIHWKGDRSDSFPTETDPLVTIHDNKTHEYLKSFDNLINSPEKRLELPEYSFETIFPDEMIDEIGIEQAHEIISKSPTLDLCS